jgi:hypothetical protein
MSQLSVPLQDDIAVEELKKIQTSMKPNQCILSSVRELMKSKLLVYRPVSLRCVNDVLLHTSSPWPSMLLIHAPGTFHFCVVSTIGNLLFDGSRGPSMDLTKENLFNAVDSVNMYEGEKSSIQIIMGYRFVKDKAKKPKKRKIEDRDNDKE